MKKIILLFAPLLLSLSSYGQYGKGIFDSITRIFAIDTSATGTGLIVSNGFAGSAWFQIAGDTTKLCKIPFDGYGGNMLMACSIHPLHCGTDYVLEFYTK